MLKKYSIWLFVIVVIGLPVLAFTMFSWYERNYQSLPVYNTNGETIVDFKMVSQKGSAITLKDWKNKTLVVDFFFTHCPSVCPKMTNNLKLVQSAYVNR